jgi:hypothetical protein
MFKEIKVYKKNENAETIFQATDNLGKNYLYRGTQVIELMKSEINKCNIMMAFIFTLSLMCLMNVMTVLEDTTFLKMIDSIITHEASFGVTLSIPLNFFIFLATLIMIPVGIISNKKDKRTIDYIIKESDGMIEKIHSQPKDMTHYKTEEETS